MITRSATLRGRVHVVRHDDAGHRVLLARPQDQLVDHVAHDRVQPGGRLVVEHQLGVQGQGPGQAHALAHAAGQLGRLLARRCSRASPTSASRDSTSSWISCVADLACARAAERPRSGRSSCCRTAPRLETGSRSGSARGVSSCSLSLARSWPSNSTSPRVGPDQPDHRLEQHGLAAAAFADDGQRLSARNRQVDVAQHRLRPNVTSTSRSSTSGPLGLAAVFGSDR